MSDDASAHAEFAVDSPQLLWETGVDQHRFRQLMSLRYILLLGILAGILILLSLPRDRQASPTFSTRAIQFAWFYKPPADGNLRLIADHYDFFILSKKDEQERDQLRALGVTTPFLQYTLSIGAHNPGPEDCAAVPWSNSVGWEAGDYCWIRDNHPDWILRDAEGNPIRETIRGQEFVHMDPSSADWRQFFLERIYQSQDELGWEGIFLDNVDGSLERYRRLGQLPAKYPDDATFQSAVEQYLAYLYTGYFQPNDRPFFANLTNMPDSSVWSKYLQYLDGAMEEAWAVDWRNGYVSVPRWDEQLTRAERVQAEGKRLVLVSQGDESDPTITWQQASARQAFAYASYLLVANGQAAFRYGSLYNRAWIYPPDTLNLGEPKGPRYQDGTRWRRDFDGGTVTVDPVSHTATITASGTPTFADVPFSHWAFEYIEAVYRGGFTAGCSSEPLQYCPEDPMNRAESAVFMERGIRGTDVTPPEPVSQLFDDLPLDSWAAKWATALYQDGYTAGCGTNPLIFCPWQPITRAEAAVYFVRMVYGPEYVPPDSPGQIYVDVPLDAWYATWVAAADAADLVIPCEPEPEPKYCPDMPLTRAVAAYMMVQAKDLLP